MHLQHMEAAAVHVPIQSPPNHRILALPFIIILAHQKPDFQQTEVTDGRKTLFFEAVLRPICPETSIPIVFLQSCLDRRAGRPASETELI